MVVCQTSLDSFILFKNRHKDTTIKKKIYDYIVENPDISAKTLSFFLDIDINVVTPRINELCKEGLVFSVNQGISDRGYKCCLWRAVINENVNNVLRIEQFGDD
jgi:hypothetical protein